MIEQRFISLGLDIGTTTTHLIFSELELTAVGEPDQVPRPGIGERKILHRGRVRFTPLLDGDRIDPAGVEAIIREEYAAAGFKPEQVKSGAVLVTGESARKENAEEVAARIADLAGGFVAAAAGPNLEGLLSGRGSGAAELSKRFRRRVLNIDIGGGTANFAWFDRGRFLDAACLRVGARHVRFDAAGRVLGFTDVGALAARCAGVGMTTGAVLPAEGRRAVAAALADSLLAGMAGSFPEDILTVTRPTAPMEPPQSVMFSGGVGELMRAGAATTAPLTFGDLGPELAQAILALRGRSDAEWVYPDEPIRATVIGAGLYAAQISGDTIWVDPAKLPLINVPVLHPYRWASHVGDAESAASMLSAAAAKADVDLSARPVAVMLPSLVELDLDGIKAVAASLVHAVKTLAVKPPLVLLMADDLGKTLGRLLAGPLGGNVLAVDELDAGEVEYVDIGRPLDDVVPVVLKTLAFG